MPLSKFKADTLGIVSALLCLIHCLLLPVLVMGGIMSDYWSEHTQWMDFLFIFLAIAAVYFASRNTRQSNLKYWMWGSAFWFAFSILLHDVYQPAVVSSAMASLVLVITHMINFRHHMIHHHRMKSAAA